MKVCTDACVFGALIGEKFSNGELPPGNILDIGTGTGLLSLMVAQKTTGIIDSVENDENAFKQAKENFAQSPWKDRINIFNEDVSGFNAGKKYDYIISNPPFFESDLKSADTKKNAAKHDTTLTLDQLLIVVNKLIAPGGLFAVLLPSHRLDYFKGMSSTYQLFPKEQWLLRHTKEHPFSRGIVFFRQLKTQVESRELVLKNGENYTAEFNRLLEDYYLYL